MGAPLPVATPGGMADGPYRWEAAEGAHGFRVLAPRPGATRRYLLAGDSWAWGWAVTTGRTLGDRLAVHLSATTGVEVAILSAGRPGADTSEVLDHARVALAEAPDLAGVVLVQPHNPRRRAVPGRAAPATRAVPPPDLAIYRLLRLGLAPLTWRRAPRQLDGALLAEAIDDVRAFVAQVRVPVWLVVTPQEVGSATSGRFGPEPEWTGLGLPWAGHALRERSCWAFTDAFHPSEAGTEALATVVAPLIAGNGPGGWATTPSCDAVDGAGPGKPPYGR